MAGVEEAIYTKLSTDAGILVHVPASRIFYLHLAEGAIFPAISFQRISTSREYTLDDTVSLTEALFQVDVWANSDLEMVTVGRVVRSVLDGFRGIVGTVNIERMLQVNEYDLPQLEGSIYRRYQSFRVLYQEQ